MLLDLTCACGTRLTPSAIAYYLGGRARKMGFWQFCPTTEESLKVKQKHKIKNFVSIKY
jgi:hypothetical protein